MRMRMIGAAAVLAVAVAAAGCGATDEDGGGGTSVAPASGPCGGHGGDAELTLRYFGGVDIEAVEDMVRRYDEEDDRVRIRPEVIDGVALQAALDLVDHDGDGALLAQVPAESLQALVAADAIEPLDACLSGPGGPVDVMFEEALRSSRVDGRLWSLPLNVNATLMLYDRVALAQAGLDPAEPPRTFDELHTMALQLRERAGVPRPVAWSDLLAALAGTDAPFNAGAGFASAEVAAAAEVMARLGADGLLAPPRHEGLPPIGTGESAFQIGDLGMVWGIGAALAEGQKPGADIGVAPLPGLHGPVAPIGGWLAALGRGASADERAAAARFLAWLQEPEQQARLHVASDALPTRVDAGDEPVLQEHWDEIPLLGEAWTAMRSAPVGYDGDGVVPGIGCSAHAALDDIVRRGASTERLTELAHAITTARATLLDDPVPFLRARAAEQAERLHDGRSC